MSVNDYLNLTESQSDAMEEFRQRMSEEIYRGSKICDDTFLLYRFLKARDFDTDKAEVMLKKCLQWRRQNEDIIQSYKPSEILKKLFGNLHIGYDKEGCPMFYLPGGTYDIKGLHMAAKYPDIEKCILQEFIKHENHLEKKGRITKILIICNDTGLTFTNTIHKKGLETCIRLVKLQQDIFPERLKAVYFINVPSYFTVGFNIAKNFLSAETLKKFHVHGTDGWQEELLELIDADQLPAFMGGTRTDPDGNPLCKTILNQGGIIDENYYIHRSKNSMCKSPGVQKLHVSRSSCSEIPLEVSEPGSIIEWEFETRSGDVVFGINYKGTAGSEDEVALSFQRLSTKDFAEVGMYKCEKPGSYVVMFDNSYSWFRSKEIYYRLKVVGTKELEDQISE